MIRCRACDAFIDGDVTDISDHEKESDHRRLLVNGKVINFVLFYIHNKPNLLTSINEDSIKIIGMCYNSFI